MRLFDRNKEQVSVCAVNKIFRPRRNVQIVNEPQASRQSLVELQGRSRDGIVKRGSVGRKVRDDGGGDNGERRGRVALWWISI